MTSFITRKKWSLLAFLLLAVVLLFCAVMPHSQIAAHAKFMQEVTPDSVMSVTLKGGSWTLMANDTWYKGTTEKADITEIQVVQKVPTDVIVLEQWNASTTLEEGIIASISTNGVLYISLGDADKAYLNEDSANAFSGFSNVVSITGLELLDASNTVNFSNMFAGCEKLELLDLTKWNVGSANDISGMFQNCTALQSMDLSIWDASKLVSIKNMFKGCTNLKSVDLSGLQTDDVLDYSGIFENCNSLTSVNISGWNTSKGVTFERLFSGCYRLNSIQQTGFDLSSAENAQEMFKNCSSLAALDVSEWNTARLKNVSGMFSSCEIIESLDVSYWDVSAVTDMSSMFSNCVNLNKVDFSKWDVSSVTTMQSMFDNCKNLSQETFETMLHWDTPSLQTTSCMFINCTKLESVNLNEWEMDNVTDMTSMFQGCESLRVFDACGLSLVKVQTARLMFADCINLESIDIENWNCVNLTAVDDIFLNVPKLQQIKVGEGVSSLIFNEFPLQLGEYISGADGKWYAESDGQGYLPGDLPANKADTYYASSTLLPPNPFDNSAETSVSPNVDTEKTVENASGVLDTNGEKQV